MKFALSIAHNTLEPGACSDAGVCENALSAGWTHACALYLRRMGHEVLVISRDSLEDKVDAVNEYDPDAALEIHFNSNINASGAETLFYPGSSSGRVLAGVVQSALVSRLQRFDRGVKEGWYQANPAKGPLYFLKKTGCPSVIIEPEFIYNDRWIKAHIHDGGETIALALDKWARETG